jgi:hypothetical protein
MHVPIEGRSRIASSNSQKTLRKNGNISLSTTMLIIIASG